MNNIKHNLKVTGIAALVMLVLVIVFVVIITATTSHPATPDATVATSIPTIAPTATIDPTTRPAYQLASLDEQGATPSPATIATYQKVLDSLHDKTGETEQGIADGTVTAQGILQKDGYSGDDRLITLLKGVDGAITKKEHQKFAESMAALITLMENGK